MDEAKRRRSRIGRLLANDDAGEIKATEAEVHAGAAEYLLDGAADRTLLFGPVVWRPRDDGAEGRQWSFIVAGCDQAGEMRHDQLNAETKADTVAFRAGIMAALIERRPCVMHDFDDELAMARFAETLWPGAKITRIREGIEAERTATRH